MMEKTLNCFYQLFHYDKTQNKTFTYTPESKNTNDSFILCFRLDLVAAQSALRQQCSPAATQRSSNQLGGFRCATL